MYVNIIYVGVAREEFVAIKIRQLILFLYDKQGIWSIFP